MSITILISTVIICRTWNNSIDAKHRELNINESDKLSKESFDTIMNLVDQIINDIFTRYTIMNFENNESLYINESMINQMMAAVLKESYLSMSPQLLDKLTLIYNKEYVDDIIAKKVQMLTISYVIEINGTYKN